MTEGEKLWRALESLHRDSDDLRSRTDADIDQVFRELSARGRCIEFYKDRCLSLELIVAGLFVLSILLTIALIWSLR